MIPEVIRDSRDKEVDSLLATIIASLNEEGFIVEFGNIGVRTTYALLHTKNHDKEIVGYTFIRNMKYYRKNVGMLKALQQAVARKKISEEESASLGV